MGAIRTAVVGLNLGMGHVRAFKALEQADLRWGVDLDEEKAAKAAEEYGCNYTTDWTSILDDVDAVSICTPHHLHFPQTLQAIRAGKHVLLEKPFANTEAECLELIEAADAHNVKLMLAYVVRYMPHMRRLKEALDSGRYGVPFSAQCWVEAYLQPRPDSWLSKKDKLGGGVLFSHGCHYVDALMWLLGTPKQVTAMGTRAGTEWMESEGTSHALMQFESGALSHIVTSWGMKYRDTPAKYQIHTPTAAFIVKGEQVDVITEEGRHTLYDPSETKQPNIFLPEIEHFLDCIATGRKPETDGRDSLKSLRAIWRMYEEQERFGLGEART